MLLAIMGRGIQMPQAGLDPTQVESWTLTNTLEITDPEGKHLLVRDPGEGGFDADDHSECRIGGAWLNLEAGIRLADVHKPEQIVCAYAHRSERLAAVGAPSESEVMSRLLLQQRPTLRDRVPVWPRGFEQSVPSNTTSELANIFDYASATDQKLIYIVSVGVHVPRIEGLIRTWKRRYPVFLRIHTEVIMSEQVLLDSGLNVFRTNIEMMRESKAFGRSLREELIGVEKQIRGTYRD